MALKHSAAALLALAFLTAGVAVGYAARPKSHYPPRFGSLGLPANCSAYVDAAVAGYRSRRFTAEETMSGLERNCGAGGQLWRE